MSSRRLIKGDTDLPGISTGEALQRSAQNSSAVFQRKSLFRLCLPLFLYAFLSILNSFLDQLLLSSYSPHLAAAVSVANHILGVAYDISGLMGVGALILIAQHLGCGEIERARSVAISAILANTVLGFLIAATLFIGGRFFVAWANTPPEIVGDAETYIYLIGIAMIGNGFLMAAAAVLRGFGYTTEILLLGVLGNALYLPLQYVLIFGRFGFPELGVTGAALSTLIVRFIGVVFLLILLPRRLGIRVKWRFPWSEWSRVKQLLRLSVPSVGDNIAYNLFQLSMVALIATLGVAGILTRSYALTFGAFLSIVANTISQGNEILVGYDQGARDHHTARRRATRTAWGTALFSSGLSVVLYLFSDQITGLFSKDPQILTGVKALFLINIVMQPFQTANVIYFNSLRAVGDVWGPVIFSVAVTWGVAFPLGWWTITMGKGGVAGLWWVLTFSEVVKTAFFALRWHRMRWRSFTLVGEGQPV